MPVALSVVSHLTLAAAAGPVQGVQICRQPAKSFIALRAARTWKDDTYTDDRNILTGYMLWRGKRAIMIFMDLDPPDSSDPHELLRTIWYLLRRRRLLTCRTRFGYDCYLKAISQYLPVGGIAAMFIYIFYLESNAAQQRLTLSLRF